MTRIALVPMVKVMSESKLCALTAACPLPLPLPRILSNRCVLWVITSSFTSGGDSSFPGRSVIASGNTILPRVVGSSVLVTLSSIFIVDVDLGVIGWTGAGTNLIVVDQFSTS